MGDMIKPREFQAKSLDDTEQKWDAGAENVLLVAPTGAGKCLGINTPVLMFDGSVKMVQDIVSGELLMGVDSTSRTVYSTTTGQEMLYRVTPTKGESYIVNESHILSLKQTGDKTTIKGNVVNISIKDYLKKSNYFKHTHKGWRTSVDFEAKSLNDLLPPYFLGLWLGDGHTDQPCITSADNEIVDYLKEYTTTHSFKLSVLSQTNNKSKVYRITNDRKRLTGLLPVMRSYGLLGFKHIPNDYKINCENSRLQLLAGILDSDGHLAKNSYYEVTFKSEKLMDDLVFLAQSLGFAAHKKHCRKKCYNNGVMGDYYRTTICGDVSKIPTKLQRHQPEPRKQKKSVLVTGISVEPIGVGDYYGFSISGDRLFLLGDFTVTHNTFIKAFMAQRFNNRNEPVVIFAHRDVLLSQISMSLAKIGLQHSLICAAATAKEIKNFHVTEFGRCYVIETAPVIVASVLTWVNRDLTHLAPLIKCWMLDEAHHLTLGTSWHKCIEPLVNAKGLGVTATPLRADKKSLGRKTIVKMNKGLSYEDFRDVGWSDELLVEHGHGKLIETGDGLFDELVVTLTMGELIELGFLCSYRIYTVPSQLDLSDVNVTSGGDYNQKKLAAASDTADITGDAVEHYKRLAYGKQAITFCVSIEHAKHVTQQFNDAGINSFMLSSKTKLRIRQKKEKEFRKGIITNLINVDLFSEGYDVPACGVVIMLRKTMSYGLMMQQFGRMLRPSADKEYGILLDHVGNVAEHFIYGAPHDSPEWTLDPPKKKKKKITDEKDTVTRTCPSCFGFYLPKSNVPTAFVCPYCGHAESDEEINNAAKEMQIREGTLVEYDNSYLTGILNEIKKTDRPVEQLKKELYAAPDIVKHSAVKNHLAKQEAQRQLRTWIGSWCENIALQRGLDIETTQGEFARVYGFDVFKAQTLPERAATDLLDKIKSNWSDHITGNSVVS